MNSIVNLIYWYGYLAMICIAITFVITLAMCLYFTASMISGTYYPDLEYLRNTTFLCITTFVILQIRKVVYEHNLLNSM